MKCASVVLLLLLLAAAAVQCGAATCAVDANSPEQVIDGFGFSSAWCGTLPSTKNVALFETLGMSILRIRIDEHEWWDGETNNVKVAHYYGAKALGSAWSGPPAWNSNGKSTGGVLLPEHYADYAAYLKRAATAHGLDWISFQNEPDMGDGFVAWTPAQMKAFVHDYHSVIDTPLVFPESFHFNDDFSDPLLNDAETVGLTDIIAGHIYGGGNYKHTNALAKGKRVWQTEHYIDGHDIGACMDDAWTVNEVMHNQFSAYIWWWVYDATDPTNLVHKNGTIYKNGYTLGQWSKFLPPGSRRISATYTPTTDVTITAYTDAKGGLVIVAVNKGAAAVSQSFSLSGLDSVNVLYVTRTTESENLADVAPAYVQSHGFMYGLPAKSVTTFHQTSYLANLAVGATASMSSVGNWCNGNNAACAPQYAVDGIFQQSLSDGFCAHSASNSGNQWWRVDLGAASFLQTVKVYLRSDCCSERAIGYSAYLSNSATAWDSSAVALGTISAQAAYQIYSFSVPANTAPQRYVEVRATNQWLAVCEMAVFGRAAVCGTSNNPCLNGGTCSENSSGYTCTCPAAFGGINCQSSCPSGFTQFTASDAPGNDISTIWGVTSYDDCATRCQQTSGCVMFSWMAQWTGCFLKSAVGSAVTDSNFLAGVCTALLPTTPLPCASGPCANGGSCGNVLAGGYMCTCSPLYTGTTCTAYASVAQLKTASMSDGVGNWCNGNGSPCSASYAVDNNYGQSLGSGFCAHTGSCSGNQWWRVDLSSVFRLSQVTLYLRTDCCTSRAVGYSVYATNSTTAWDSNAVALGSITAESSGQVYTMLVPSTAPTTRYVEVRVKDQCLTICEAAVIGRAP